MWGDSVTAKHAQTNFDLLIIGGGVNGAGIARDAAGRGLRVLLCEKNDLGGATSAASTKLIHGGLRYLEQYDFRLVGESLRERVRLLGIAPHIIWPLRFVLPYERGQRPRWMIRLGLWLYDHLGNRGPIPASQSVNLLCDPAGVPLKEHFRTGYSYWDCWVQDNRLVVLNAMDAKAKGADIRPRTAVSRAERWNGSWRVTLSTGETITARLLVNAAGPWSAQILDSISDTAPPGPLSLVKGSHIVIPRIAAHDSAYLLQNEDRRVVFAIPYEQEYTLLGTTEVGFKGDPGSASIDSSEIEYLCSAANRFFAQAIRPDAVHWSFSGVRPLFGQNDDPSDISRGYRLILETGRGAPLLNIFGGKLTTYRKLAEEAMAMVSPILGYEDRPWTATRPLPGGEFDARDFCHMLAELQATYPWLSAQDARRFLRHYGTRTHAILKSAKKREDLGRHFGFGITEAELDYAVCSEWVQTGEDFFWRRTKAGLRLTEKKKKEISHWIETRSKYDRVAE